MTLYGIWQNGYTSQHQSAVLCCDESGQLTVKLTDITATSEPQTIVGKEVAHANIEDIEISDRVGSIPRKFTFNTEFVHDKSLSLDHTFSTQAMFVCDNNNAVDKLISTHKQSTWRSIVFLLESNLSFALISLCVAAAIIISSLFYAIPYAAEKIAFKLPASLLNKSSDYTLKVLDKAYLSESQLSEKRQQQIRTYFEEHDSQKRTILFRQGGLQVNANAFALPSGVIVFTDELVGLANDDQQLLAIYFHETAHIKRRHSIRSVLQASSIVIIGTFMLGDVSGVAESIFALPVFLVESSYSRKFETEADDYAFESMQKNNIPLHHFADILSALVENNTGNSDIEHEDDALLSGYLASHPATNKRIVRFLKNSN